MDVMDSGNKEKLSKTVYLVEERPNPSTDYFILPRLPREDYKVKRCSLDDLPAEDALDGAILIFVRYLSPGWARLVDSVRPRLDRVVFFMDDDVLDPATWGGLPWRYRRKLKRYSAHWDAWLRETAAELWVSTPYLLEKYSDREPRLVEPSPPEVADDPVRVFYHGTASHRAEIEWLRPVMEKALAENSRLYFEITGGRDVYRLYRDLPRTTVIHPMKWPAYRAFLSLGGRDIGLAPLLDGAFNQARSHTKFFDITRCGAVGIYADQNAFSGIVTHGQEGLLLAMDPDAWLAAILDLAEDESCRQALLGNAKAKVADLSPPPNLPG